MCRFGFILVICDNPFAISGAAGLYGSAKSSAAVFISPVPSSADFIILFHE